MVVEAILNLFKFIIFGFLGAIPIVSVVTIPVSFFTTLCDFLSVCAYFLPLDFLIVVIGVHITLDSIDFFIKLIYRIKSFIPSMGN